MVEIKGAKINKNGILFNIGYQKKISQILIFILMIFYIFILISASLLFTSYGNYWFLGINTITIISLHFFLYIVKSRGDQIVVILQESLDNNSANYTIQYGNNTIAQGTFEKEQIVVRPIKTFTGIYHNTSTVHFYVVLLLRIFPLQIKNRDENGLVLIRLEKESAAVEEVKKIFHFLGMDHTDVKIERISD